MRVRIKATPHEHEIDGVKLEFLLPGSVRDVSPNVGAWLMAEGYAELEMRAPDDVREQRTSFGATKTRSHAPDRRRKSRRF
jgi:hypothetical protein